MAEIVPSVKIQDLRTLMELMKCLMRIKQNQIVSSSPKKQKLAVGGQWLGFSFFRERESSFSLDLRPFEPWVLVGVGGKVVLRRKGYAWAPILWNSDNFKRYVSFPTCVIL